MSLKEKIVYYMECDWCPKKLTTLPMPEERSLIHLAKLKNWTTDDNGNHYCPYCTKVQEGTNDES